MLERGGAYWAGKLEVPLWSVLIEVECRQLYYFILGIFIKSSLSNLMTSRHYCFTLFINSSSFEVDFALCPNLKLMVYQKEVCPQTERLHVQGYLELITPARKAAIKRWPGFAGVHLENREGSRLQAIEYCIKPDSRLPGTTPSSFGVGSSLENFLSVLRSDSLVAPRTSNSSARLDAIRTKLLEGSTSEQIADSDFDLWVRYYRAFERYSIYKTPPRNEECTVHVVVGPTGTGKSRWAMDTFPGAYWKQRSNWWDGYLNHKVVIIDEFYGWLPFDLLLRLCDRYPLMVETKGGQSSFIANTIVITSNRSPDKWYRDSYFASFARRVKTWHAMLAIDEHQEFNDYTLFKRLISPDDN